MFVSKSANASKHSNMKDTVVFYRNRRAVASKEPSIKQVVSLCKDISYKNVQRDEEALLHQF